MKRNNITQHSGILALDKPAGITSHDLVDLVRDLTGERRVGHAGTLDPFASGLMYVCVGPAARLSNYLTNKSKTYVARFVFGAATDTDDKLGKVVYAYQDASKGNLKSALKNLINEDPNIVMKSIQGHSLQLPPAYSAIKKGGVKAYEAARRGKTIDLEPREICIHSADVLSTGFMNCKLNFEDNEISNVNMPYWDIRLSVSKGTYVRSIARDLGQRFNCGAHVESLRRVKIDNFNVDDSLTIEKLKKEIKKNCEIPWVNPVKLLNFPSYELSKEHYKLVSNGRTIPVLFDFNEPVCLIFEKRIVALGAVDHNVCKPICVFHKGVAGVV